MIALEPLILMKLMSNRRKDQVHVEDMINVGLIDPSWLAKLPPELAVRLKHIMDTAGRLTSDCINRLETRHGNRE